MTQNLAKAQYIVRKYTVSSVLTAVDELSYICICSRAIPTMRSAGPVRLLQSIAAR
jgi:hypothetical protein